MGNLWAAEPGRPRAQWTYLCDVVIWAWPIASWIENTPAPPKGGQAAVRYSEGRATPLPARL